MLVGTWRAIDLTPHYNEFDKTSVEFQSSGAALPAQAAGWGAATPASGLTTNSG